MPRKGKSKTTQTDVDNTLQNDPSQMSEDMNQLNATETELMEAQDIEEMEDVVIPEAANAMAPPRAQDVVEDHVEDDDFGNRIDYQPMQGQSIYREPMQGGNHWGSRRQGRGKQHGKQRHQRHQRHQHAQQPEQEGVLSIRQPGWKDRMESSEEQEGVLTIRQQGDLARSLRHNQNKGHTYISKPGRHGNDSRRRNENSRGRNSQSRRNTNRRNQHGK